MDAGLQNAYLEALGIQRWVVRGVSSAVAGPADEPREEAKQDNTVSTMDWEALRAQVTGCRRCALHETRTQVVFGTGDRNADWMLIGEAPGADEDRQGEPFVGRAGQLLNEMLFAAGYRREQVYIANILKCRPPENRNPRPEEVSRCEDYLLRQIELVQPKIILALGGIAAQNLLHTEESVGRLRGMRHSFGESGIPLVVTYHPAYLLRSPLEKRKVWIDLQFAREVYSELQAMHD
ncbi:MAG: uracil-DNA glycosylase [Gammaproteobacteria bacterium]